MNWRCDVCGHVRQPGEPTLASTVSDFLRLGRCAHEDGKPMRPWRPTDAVPAGARDVAEGERLKAEGQALTYTGNGDWGARFDVTLRSLAGSGEPFTSEDVTARVGLPAGRSPSAVGAHMTAAAKLGVIAKTGRRVKAKRPNQHAAELTEWVGI